MTQLQKIETSQAPSLSFRGFFEFRHLLFRSLVCDAALKFGSICLTDYNKINMAGSIYINKDKRWAANNSAFQFVTDFLIRNSDDVYVVGAIKEIASANVGVIDLDNFNPEKRQDILTLLSTKLIPDAQGLLPQDLPQREAYLLLLGELVELAS